MELVSLADLAAQVRQRAPGGSLDRVEAALAASAELSASADDLIGLFVTEARDADCSWTEIGERIGVSKQAARQRFVRQPPAGTPAGGEMAGGLPRQARLAACLDAAGREARADGAAEIGTEHLLAGLLHEGVAAAILEKLGVRADAIRAASRELFGASEPPAAGEPQESAEAREAIRGAGMLARRAGLGSVGPEQLLGAIALDPGSRARRVLVHLGVSIPAVKRELECYVSPQRQRRRRPGKSAPGQCSFCGKQQAAELQLIFGPGVAICAECVSLCNEILAEGRPA